MKNAGPVSMRDVAALAGVSAATVSLCLRRSPLISLPTRERVLAAVKTLGYRPHPFVQSLMRSRRRRGGAALGPVLAFVTAYNTRDGWRNDPTPVFRQMFSGAQARATDCGYRLQEFWLREPRMTPQRFSTMLRARAIHGLVLAPFPEPHANLTLDWEHFAAVALGFTLESPVLHRVNNDHFHSMITSLEECHRLGHRRIGLAISATVNDKVQRRWLAAYLLAHDLFPGLVLLDPLITDPLSEAAFRAWYRRQRPQVIITASPQPLTAWLKSQGRHIPADIGLVSLSSPRPGDALTGIYQNSEHIGRRSIDLLVTLLEHNELGLPSFPDTLLVDGTWNPGQTLQAARPRPTRVRV